MTSKRQGPRILAAGGQKGGVGKTLTTISLACEALSRGLRVLVCDADPQGTSCMWHALAQERGHSAPHVVRLGATMHKPNELPEMSRAYDLTVIDLPPRHAEVQRSALLVADLVLMPCGGSSSDAWALLASLKLVEEAKKLRPRLDAAILLNRIRTNTAIGRGARDILSSTGWRVLRSELHDRIVYQEAVGEGLGPAQYAPKSDAAEEVRALVDEILPWAKLRSSKRPTLGKAVAAR